MNEIEVCEHCRPHYDAARDMWWPGDCAQCVARFRPRTCEHPCGWLWTDYAIDEETP